MFLVLLITIHLATTMMIPINVVNYYCPSISMQSNDTIASLYEIISKKLPCIPPSREISIILNERIILNLANDPRTIHKIGFCNQSNDIQVIAKPECVSLLEMLGGVTDIRNIPWIDDVFHCISNPSAQYCHAVSQLTKVLIHDNNGDLIEINLSHLKLTGTVYLQSLPQTVRSLDLSFNDLDTLNLHGLGGKSLEQLNVEQNRRYHIQSEVWTTRSGQSSPIVELRLSSNQIFPEINDFRDKMSEIYNWRPHGAALKMVIMDGVPIPIANSLFIPQMLQVIRGVTNKERIPWYKYFVDGVNLRHSDWKALRVRYLRGRNGNPNRYLYNLSGLGLGGHVDLGSLPRNVVALDLSHNNLSSISLAGTGEYTLKKLNLENNDNLRIDLMQIDPSSSLCCLYALQSLSISSNQLRVDKAFSALAVAVHWRVYHWLAMQSVTLDNVIVDGRKITRGGVRGQRHRKSTMPLPSHDWKI